MGTIQNNTNLTQTTKNQQVMKNSVKKQSKSINTSGSFINWLYSNNMSIPEKGKGATVCLWSDRHAYEVNDVSKDGKTVTIQRYNAKRVDDNGMSDSQSYEYKELTEQTQTIVWYRGKWRLKGFAIVYTDDFSKVMENQNWVMNDEQNAKAFDDNGDLQVVEGMTRKKTKYNVVNIIWGVRDEHYDFTF